MFKKKTTAEFEMTMIFKLISEHKAEERVRLEEAIAFLMELKSQYYESPESVREKEFFKWYQHQFEEILDIIGITPTQIKQQYTIQGSEYAA